MNGREASDLEDYARRGGATVLSDIVQVEGSEARRKVIGKVVAWL